MSIFSQAQNAVNSYLPGLSAQLKTQSFCQNEAPRSEVISWFKQAGGAGSMVKSCYGGMDLTPWQAVLLQIGLGSLSPSLAIAAGMHQFSIATLQEMAKTATGLESLLLEAIAKNHLLVASAFSEGQSAKSILNSNIIAKPHKKGFLVSGVKQPCSLAYDMDLLTASVRVEPCEGEPYFAVALIHKGSDGICIKPFWQAPFLQASQSESVQLNEVYVPHSMMVNVDEQQAYQAHISGFVWFELLTSASYLGMVYGLLNTVIETNRLPMAEKVTAYMQLDMGALALKAIAYDMQAQTPDTLAHILSVRYQLQKDLPNVVANVMAAVGGINYINQPYFSAIAQIIHAFNFHPPAKHVMLAPLNQYFDHQPLVMV